MSAVLAANPQLRSTLNNRRCDRLFAGLWRAKFILPQCGVHGNTGRQSNGESRRTPPGLRDHPYYRKRKSNLLWLLPSLALESVAPVSEDQLVGPSKPHGRAMKPTRSV